MSGNVFMARHEYGILDSMNTPATMPLRQPVVYPESDGQPIAENTLQFQYIVMVEGGLDAQFAAESNVFVAGDLFWYPVEGNPNIRQAPDIMVVFGRPKGHRGSYRQWEEDNIAPQVVWEILSPGNRHGEMVRKFLFYDRHGVEEYYVYDPDRGNLEGWLRAEGELREISNMEGWVSPRLKVRMNVVNGELHLFHPDGRRFATYVEMAEQRDQAERKVQQLTAQLKKLGVEPENQN